MKLLIALTPPLDWNLANTRNMLVAITVVTLTIIIFGLIIGIVLFKRGHNAKAVKPVLRISFALTGIILLISAISVITLDIGYNTAVKHGAFTRDMTIRFMYDGIKTTHIESKLPENLSGTIIIYYRFDCPGCRAIYKEESIAAEGVKNIYFISAKGEQGIALMKDYPVETLPSGIYIRNYTYNGALSYTKKSLCEKDINGQYLFIPENFQRLIALQTEGR